MRVTESLDDIASRGDFAARRANAARGRQGCVVRRARNARAPRRDDKIPTSRNAPPSQGCPCGTGARESRWATWRPPPPMRSNEPHGGPAPAGDPPRRPIRPQRASDDHAFRWLRSSSCCRRAFGAKIEWAAELADALLARFEDGERGGSSRAMTTKAVSPDQADTTTLHLQQRCRGIGVDRVRTSPASSATSAAERTVRLFAPALAESPGGYSSLLEAQAAPRSAAGFVLLAGDRGLRAAAGAREDVSPGGRCSISRAFPPCRRPSTSVRSRRKERWPWFVAAWCACRR